MDHLLITDSLFSTDCKAMDILVKISPSTTECVVLWTEHQDFECFYWLFVYVLCGMEFDYLYLFFVEWSIPFSCGMDHLYMNPMETRWIGSVRTIQSWTYFDIEIGNSADCTFYLYCLLETRNQGFVALYVGYELLDSSDIVLGSDGISSVDDAVPDLVYYHKSCDIRLQLTFWAHF